MPDPTVLCVMLANGRQKMVERAVRCFERQTYPNAKLLVYDTGAEPLDIWSTLDAMHHVRVPAARYESIGTLRNCANAFAAFHKAEIIVHWDSDDWSAPDRVERQVAFLKFMGAECVGYQNLLFWLGKETYCYTTRNPRCCPGTTLCYWTSIWKHQPFPDLRVGEDAAWLENINVRGSLSIVPPAPIMMIATVHGENTNTAYRQPGFFQCPEFQRAADLDETVRGILEAA